MDARLIAVMALVACGGAEPPQKSSASAPSSSPPPVASVASSAGVTSDSSDAPIDAHRIVRGSLIRSHLAYLRLRRFAECGGDAGVCPPIDDLRTQRVNVAKRLEEAKAFAATHPEALPAETQCLTTVLEQTDRLVSAMQASRGEASEREELARRIGRCKESFAATVAAYGAPMGTLLQHGNLEPHEIQGVVRASFGRFKLCYTPALRRDKSLAGRVVADFIIDIDGTVADVRLDATTIADQQMNDCILRKVAQLRFPQPEGAGYVTVGYPLIFSPGNGETASDGGARSAESPSLK